MEIVLLQIDFFGAIVYADGSVFLNYFDIDSLYRNFK